MSDHHTTEAIESEDHHEAGLTKSKIWQVAGVLLLITVVEFIIALWAIPGHHISQHIGNYMYICLTLVKAFYIVGYFMHLKFERLGLQLALSLSFLFIGYFIILMLIEGSHLNSHMIFN